MGSNRWPLCRGEHQPFAKNTNKYKAEVLCACYSRSCLRAVIVKRHCENSLQRTENRMLTRIHPNTFTWKTQPCIASPWFAHIALFKGRRFVCGWELSGQKQLCLFAQAVSMRWQVKTVCLYTRRVAYTTSTSQRDFHARLSKMGLS